MACFHRYYCYRRHSMLDDPWTDIKWVQENGFRTIRRRPSETARIDSYGDFIGNPDWSDLEVYIIYKQIIDKDNQTVFGETNFEGNDTIKFITVPSYDIKINDLILIPAEYKIFPETNSSYEVYKVKNLLANTFSLYTPRTITLTCEKRLASSTYLYGL